MCFVQRKENNSLAVRQHPTRTIGLFSWATKPPNRPTAAWCDRPWHADVKCCKVLRYMSNTFNFVFDFSWISNQAFLSIVWRPANRMQRKSSAQRPHCACSKLHCTVPQLQGSICTFSDVHARVAFYYSWFGLKCFNSRCGTLPGSAISSKQVLKQYIRSLQLLLLLFLSRMQAYTTDLCCLDGLKVALFQGIGRYVK